MSSSPPRAESGVYPGLIAPTCDKIIHIVEHFMKSSDHGGSEPWLLSGLPIYSCQDPCKVYSRKSENPPEAIDGHKLEIAAWIGSPQG
jgi:hypothetical protein